jgi:hypothetical protein
MRPRYEAFADNFIRGMRRLPEGLEVYRHLLHTLAVTPDEQLLDGIDAKELHRRIIEHANVSITKSTLISTLERVDRLQARMEIRPIVLTYSRYSQRVFVVDRSFLFFRKYGDAKWPWEEEEFEPTNDLALEDPLELT